MISIQINHPSLGATRTLTNESEVENVKRAIEWLTEVALTAAILEDRKKERASYSDRFGIAIVVRPDLPDDQVILVDSRGQETVINNIKSKSNKETIYEQSKN